MVPRFLIDVPDQPGRSDDLPSERGTLVPQHPRRQAQRIVRTSQTEGAVCAADCEEPPFAGPLDPSWFLAAGPGQQTPARPPRIASSARIRVWMVQRLSHPKPGLMAY
jgi:hypothetical protein